MQTKAVPSTKKPGASGMKRLVPGHVEQSPFIDWLLWPLFKDSYPLPWESHREFDYNIYRGLSFIKKP